VFGIAAALVASLALGAPVKIGQQRAPCPRCLGRRPVSVIAAPHNGTWVFFEGPRTDQLAKISEDGSVTPVSLPPKLRGRSLEVMPLSDGWTVATERVWPGGVKEEDRCAQNEDEPTRPPHCGALVVAQYSPTGHWTAPQRLADSSVGAVETGETGLPAAAASDGRIECARASRTPVRARPHRPTRTSTF
jgi:hypothetical protein